MNSWTGGSGIGVISIYNQTSLVYCHSYYVLRSFKHTVIDLIPCTPARTTKKSSSSFQTKACDCLSWFGRLVLEIVGENGSFLAGIWGGDILYTDYSCIDAIDEQSGISVVVDGGPL